LGRWQLFPTDSGILDVRNFGAIGDGIADDTNAILKAIASLPAYTEMHPFLIRIVYFPPGTYLVTNTIQRRADGLFLPNLVLIGHDRTSTFIKLADHAPGFENPTTPKAVLYTASGLVFMRDPHDGGRQYPERGEGNEAFGNTIENLTVDVGTGNPGAIGIDFLANNVGALRNLTIRAPDRAAIGLSMTRRWPGPALVDDVSISGFDIGIDIAYTLYSMTLERVRIAECRRYGVRNNSNILSFHDLQISMNGGFGIANLTADGLIVGIDGLISGTGTAALINRGSVNFKNVAARDLKSTNGRSLDTELDGVFQEDKKLSEPFWHLAIQPTPKPDPLSASNWVSVEKFGVKAGIDSTGAFMAAFASDAKVIYIPSGTYYLSLPLLVADNIERIEGMFSVVNIGNDPHATEDAPSPLFRTNPGRRTPLFIRRLVIERRGNMSYLIEWRGKGTLIISDVIGLFGTGLLYRAADGGPVFADNTTAGHTEIAGSAPLWFRQYNAEGPTVRLTNSGAPLWILGAKSEQTNTLVQCLNGGDSEVVGGFIARVFPTLPEMPAFQAINARLALAYAEDVYRAEAIYRIHLDARHGEKQMLVRAEDLPRRGRWARMAAGLSTDNLDRK
jgi:hypothetical protein